MNWASSKSYVFGNEYQELSRWMDGWNYNTTSWIIVYGQTFFCNVRLEYIYTYEHGSGDERTAFMGVPSLTD